MHQALKGSSNTRESGDERNKMLFAVNEQRLSPENTAHRKFDLF